MDDELENSFCFSHLANEITKLKKKHFVTEALIKSNFNKTQLTNFANMITEINMHYSSLDYEIRLSNKKEAADYHQIKNELTKMKQNGNQPLRFNDLVALNDIDININNNALSTSKDDLIAIENVIKETECSSKTTNIRTSFVRAKFYAHVLNKKIFDRHTILEAFKISRSTLYNYITFHDLTKTFPGFLHTNLSFAIIIKNIKYIREILNTDPEMRNAMSINN